MTFETTIKRMIESAAIDRIEITVTRTGYHARAIPCSFHTIVSERREQAVLNAGESVTIAEMERIQSDCLRPLASAYAGTIEEALALLKNALERT